MGELSNKLDLSKDSVTNVQTIDYAGAFATINEDNSFSIEEFQKNLQIKIIQMKENFAEFDVLGLDAALANALRRIMLAEIATCAIEDVTIYQNTNEPMKDEMLAHRLGLIPLNIDGNDLDWRSTESASADAEQGRLNKVRFVLKAKCPPNKERLTVTAKDLVWAPESEQERAYFLNDNEPSRFTKAGYAPAALYDDIVITKLARNQEIDVVMYATKGVGKDHAKWSPVGTAWYRLHPNVTLKEDVVGEDAEKLKNLCPMGVLDVQEQNGVKKAVVIGERKCTTCRECIQDEWSGKVSLQKWKHHFIFSIESIGQLQPIDIFQRAIAQLHAKCATALKALKDPEDEE